MVSCLMGDSTALASAIVRCCLSITVDKVSFISLDESTHKDEYYTTQSMSYTIENNGINPIYLLESA